MFTMKSFKLWAAVAATGLGMAAATATADPRDHRDHRDDRDGKVRVGVDLNLGGGRGPRYEERSVKVWVEPVYRTTTDKVWVEPEYKTVTDKVWKEPVMKVQAERAWVPDRYEWRWVYRRDRFGVRIRVRERVLVERGHYENRETQVVVTPGCWETVERQELAAEGHWDNVQRRQLVQAGHYEWRTERVQLDRGRRDTVVGLGLDWDLD